MGDIVSLTYHVADIAKFMARERQRFWVGLPLLAAGLLGAWALARTGRGGATGS
jgi:hypothetical protein